MDVISCRRLVFVYSSVFMLLLVNGQPTTDDYIDEYDELSVVTEDGRHGYSFK